MGKKQRKFCRNVVKPVKRELQILEKLYHESRFFTMDELADSYAVTTRMIRNDLKYLDEYLLDTGAYLKRDRTHGVMLDKSSCSDKTLRKLIYNRTDNYYPADTRRSIILQMLLLAKGYIPTTALMERTNASKTTTIKDLAVCETWLEEREIELEKRPRNGIRISTDEKCWRNAMLDYLEAHFGEMEFKMLLGAIRGNQSFILNLSEDDCLNYFLYGINTLAVENFLRKFEWDNGIRYSDDAFVRIFLYLCLAMKRISEGYEINEKQDAQPNMQTDWMHSSKSWLDENIDILAKPFNDKHESINISQAERYEIQSYLMGGNQLYDTITEQSYSSQEIHLTDCFLSLAQNYLGFDLKNDKMLFENLYMHIKPAIHRVMFDIQVNNPLKDEIKENYRELFNVCSMAAECFYQTLGKRMNEDEISFLTMHVAACIEKIKSDTTALNYYKAAIICPNGVGTRYILHARVLNEFPNILVDSIVNNVHDLESRGANVDFILSTIPLYGVKKPVITVSPLLNNRDIQNIKRYMDKNELTNKQDKSSLVEDLITIVGRYCSIYDYQGLQDSINAYLLPNTGMQDDNLPSLYDFASQGMIALNYEVQNWEQAVKMGGELLLENGNIDRRYIYSMIKRKKEYGPYIVIGDGIAMPHAQIEDGVNKTGMSFLTLKHPVVFGNENYDPVRLVVTLCADNSMTHLRAISDLLRLLEKDDLLEDLCNCANEQQFLSILEELDN